MRIQDSESLAPGNSNVHKSGVTTTKAQATAEESIPAWFW